MSNTWKSTKVAKGPGSGDTLITGDEKTMRHYYYKDVANTWCGSWENLKDIQEGYTNERHPVFASLAKGLSLNYYSRESTADAIMDAIREHRARLPTVSLVTDIPYRGSPSVLKSYSPAQLRTALLLKWGTPEKKDSCREEDIEAYLRPFIICNKTFFPDLWRHSSLGHQSLDPQTGRPDLSRLWTLDKYWCARVIPDDY